jgi:hypothetical protein
MSGKSVFLIFVEYFLSQIFLAILISTNYEGLPFIYKLTPSFLISTTQPGVQTFQYFVIPLVFLIAINLVSLVFTKNLFHSIKLDDNFFCYRNLLAGEIVIIVATMVIQIPINLSFYNLVQLPSINLSFLGNFTDYYLFSIMYFAFPAFFLCARVLYYFSKLCKNVATTKKLMIEILFILTAVITSVFQVYQYNSWQPSYSFSNVLGQDASYILWFFPFVYLQTRFVIMGFILIATSILKKTVYSGGLILQLIFVSLPSFTLFMINVFRLNLGEIFGMLYFIFFIPFNIIIINAIFIISNLMELKRIKK